MKNTLSLAAVALGGLSVPASADIFKDADAGLDLRYRLEWVDQDGFDRSSTASTLLTRLHVRTGEVGGFSGFIEGTRTTVIGQENYNSTVNGKTDRPVIADPELNEFNQGYIQYRREGLQVRLGRQGFNLDNQRFIGTVAFRQNDQTYDSLSLQMNRGPVKGFYAYVWNVNRIFGNSHPLGDFDSNIHIINASYDGLGIGKLTGYAYLLDINNQAALGLSSATYGVRFTGKQKLSDSIRLAYEAEYASQSDYKDSPLDYNTDYLMGSAAVTASAFTLKLGYEQLGSDNGVGFKTPLATLHKFNGWADLFLVTPGAGLQDLNISLGVKVPGDGPMGGTAMRVIYHDFKSDVGGTDYGTEWGFIASKKLTSWLNAEFKAAFYSADDFGRDTSRLWFTLASKF